jgi:hypothetical protein
VLIDALLNTGAFGMDNFSRTRTATVVLAKPRRLLSHKTRDFLRGICAHAIYRIQ